jgi:lipoate-protein ligase B
MRVPQSVSAQPLRGRAIYLGHIDYALAWRLQLELVERRVRGEIPDTVLLCQHLDVITVGRRQRAQANILDARFPVFEVERGGDATYHGPGQLVGYPILLLRPGTGDEDRWGERDLHAYLRGLEEALCLLCAQLGVSATRKEGYTGVWTADQARKLASLGIAVRRWGDVSRLRSQCHDGAEPLSYAKPVRAGGAGHDLFGCGRWPATRGAGTAVGRVAAAAAATALGLGVVAAVCAYFPAR